MDGFFVMAWFPLGGFLLATGLAGLRTGALPRWLAWATLGLGVLALVVWTGWIAEFLIVPWILAVTAVLRVRRPTSPR